MIFPFKIGSFPFNVMTLAYLTNITQIIMVTTKFTLDNETKKTSAEPITKINVFIFIHVSQILH